MIETCVAAFGPNLLTNTSIVKNANQERRMPQSNANQSKLPVSILLFAKRFIPTIETTNNARTTDGMLLSSSTYD